MNEEDIWTLWKSSFYCEIYSSFERLRRTYSPQFIAIIIFLSLVHSRWIFECASKEMLNQERELVLNQIRQKRTRLGGNCWEIENRSRLGSLRNLV